MTMKNNDAVVQLHSATLRFGRRTLWAGLNASVQPGEFVAVLGPNGTGKTTLLRILLGLERLTAGSVSVLGTEPGKSNAAIGYVPQQKNFDRNLPIRGRDLVELGLNGRQFGWHNHAAAAKQVQSAITFVKAEAYADNSIGLLSGGEQQRLRIAQALVGSPQLLLCDEPLLSLDLPSQTLITHVLDDYRKRTQAAIVFVTHEINPILPYVDKVLYLANGQWVIDTPQRVLQSDTLTRLYGSPVEVLRHNGRLLVIGADEAAHANQGTHHEEHA